MLSECRRCSRKCSWRDLDRAGTDSGSGPMPPSLACKFTVSELAVLRIIGDEVRQHGHCARCVDEIAARAGVCRRMVQNALREAARLGLLTVEERRREGRRNLPNVIRIISKEWATWLTRGGRSSRSPAEPLIGCKKMRPTDNHYKNQRSRTSEPAFAARGRQAGSAVHNGDASAPYDRIQRPQRTEL